MKHFLLALCLLALTACNETDDYPDIQLQATTYSALTSDQTRVTSFVVGEPIAIKIDIKSVDSEDWYITSDARMASLAVNQGDSAVGTIILGDQFSAPIGFDLKAGETHSLWFDWEQVVGVQREQVSGGNYALTFEMQLRVGDDVYTYTDTVLISII